MEENKRLATGEELQEEKKRRLEKYDYQKEEDFSKISQWEILGWSVDKKYKSYVRLKKEKKIPFDEQFENEVWLLFQKLGFSAMNKSRYFKLPYSFQGENLTQQIDIFAADDESIIIIECKASECIDKKTTFKTEIESIGGKMQGVFAAARKLFPNRKLKAKYIFATKNYALSDKDKERMSDFNIVHFDEDSIKYYTELHNHLEIISRAIRESKFYNTYKNNSVIIDGLIDKGEAESTFKSLLNYLLDCFNYLEAVLPNDWTISTSQDNAIIANPFIYGFIRIFSDVLEFLAISAKINPKNDCIEDIMDKAKPYLDCVAHTVEGLSTNERLEIRKGYGRVGDKRFWRILQRELHNKYQSFNPEGLEQYWIDHSNRYNEEAFKIIRDIELLLKKTTSNKLQDKYGKNWFRNGCPKTVYDAATKLASDKNYNKKDDEEDVLPQDQLHLIDYREIVLYSSNWSELFEVIFADPFVKGDKKKRTEWMEKLNKIRNQNDHTYCITEEEFTFIKTTKDWLFAKVEKND